MRNFFGKTRGQYAADCDWESLFGPSSVVVALPSWRQPKLFLSGNNFPERWARSSLYPAFRLSARLMRLTLRAWGTTGFSKKRTPEYSEWPLGTFTEKILPSITVGSVLIGTPSPAQKIVVKLLDSSGKTTAYLKYGNSATSQMRLQHEYQILSSLPSGLGPSVLKFGVFADGVGLLLSQVPGNPVSIRAPMPNNVMDFLEKLNTGVTKTIDTHPFIQHLREFGDRSIERWIGTLSERKWALSIQHGDFTPWNILANQQGIISAIDWEYATLNGFPHFDHAYFLLQVARLIHRLPPSTSLMFVLNHMSNQIRSPLKKEELEALARLTAYAAYRAEEKDGRIADCPEQLWLREIWSGKA